jgi:outer membrane receptor protein involved in Fe transport
MKTKKILLTGLFLMATLFCSWGQEFGIFGKVVDQYNTPVSFANILLTRSSDSSFVAGTSSDNDGNFSIIPLEKDYYSLSITFIGYKRIDRSFYLDRDIDLKSIVLEENSETLDEISIIAKKPTITRKPDRLVFNIENTALTEGSTLQVLKSTPGIIVTDESINIKNSPAAIYINNKRVQLTSNELIQLLESSPANAIKSVEVITNPPASYDADSGNVINITMSKNLIAGYRGNVYGSYRQGFYPRYNLGTSHFLKNDKLSFNVNYNYSHDKINRDDLSVVNYLDSNNSIQQIWTSDINRTTRAQTHNLNLNLDYELDERNTLSFSSTVLYTPYFKYNIFNNTNITDPNGTFLSRFTADNSSRDEKYNIGSDLDYNHRFDSGADLRVNAHYTRYDYQRNQGVFSEFFDENNDFDSDSEFITTANQVTNIITSKIDYSAPLSDNSGSFDVGAKFSNIQTDSDIIKEDLIGETPVLDPLNSDAFNYNENVYAGYLNYSRSWERWDLNIGIRAEQTDVRGESVSLNTINTQNYLEWFPNISLSHDLTDDLSFKANYNRSIVRPNYTNLNPFTFFLNENTVVVGNPALLPTFIDHAVVGMSFLNYFTIEAYYKNFDGNINELPLQNNETNIISYAPVNVDKTVDYGFDFIVDFYMTDWWSIYAFTSFYNISEETFLNESFVSLSQWSNYSGFYNTLYLLDDSSLSINFNVDYASKFLSGLSFVDPLILSSLSVSKSIWNDRAVLSLSVEDLFNEQDVLWRTNI